MKSILETVSVENIFLNIIVQGIGLFAALKSVSSQNPVSCILWLILVFLSFSCIIIYVGAEFLGLVFLVVYVGAIAVLFLFVVMMLNVRITEINSKFLTYFPISGLVIAALIILMSSLIYPAFSSFGVFLQPKDWLNSLNYLTNLQVLGQLLYTYFFPLFLISSMILLVAMIGSILLSLQKKDNVKKQLIANQLSHNFKSQLSLKT